MRTFFCMTAQKYSIYRAEEHKQGLVLSFAQAFINKQQEGANFIYPIRYPWYYF